MPLIFERTLLSSPTWDADIFWEQLGTFSSIPLLSGTESISPYDKTTYVWRLGSDLSISVATDYTQVPGTNLLNDGVAFLNVVIVQRGEISYDLPVAGYQVSRVVQGTFLPDTTLEEVFDSTSPLEYGFVDASNLGTPVTTRPVTINEESGTEYTTWTDDYILIVEAMPIANYAPEERFIVTEGPVDGAREAVWGPWLEMPQDLAIEPGIPTLIRHDANGDIEGDTTAFLGNLAAAVWQGSISTAFVPLRADGIASPDDITAYVAAIEAELAERLADLPNGSNPLIGWWDDIRDAMDALADGRSEGRAEAIDSIIRNTTEAQRLYLPLIEQAIAAVAVPDSLSSYTAWIAGTLPELLAGGGFSIVRNANDGNYTIRTGGSALSSDEGDVSVSINVKLGNGNGDAINNGIDIVIGPATGEAGQGYAGAGDDWIAGTAAVGQQVNGGAGVDTVSYAGSPEGVNASLAGTAGIGGYAEGDRWTGFEVLIGSDGNDSLSGAAGNEVLQGGKGDDRLVGGRGADRLDGGEGHDTVDYSTATGALVIDLAGGRAYQDDAAGDVLVSIEEVVGSNYGDTIAGTSGADILHGGGGDDVLKGGGSADTLDGGDGLDIASYYHSTEAVVIDLGAGRGLAGAEALGDVYISIEGVNGSNFAGDTIAGSEMADVLQGYGGDDVLKGRGGADTLDGGAGFDVASYYHATQGVIVDLALGRGLSGNEAVGDVFISIEGVNGSNFAGDSLSGTALSDTLRGYAGDDVLRGRGGADTLDGGAGNDLASYYAATEGVHIDLALGRGLSGAEARGDVLISIEAINGSNVGGDILSGSAAAETLSGFGGNDVLRGRGGGDILDGGAGMDVASYTDAAGAVVIDLQAGTSYGSDARGDTLISIEGVEGSAYDDTLAGGSGVDTLTGFAGNDTLRGREGGDILDGGLGQDLATYYGAASGISVSLEAGTGSRGEAAGDTLISIEMINGSNHDDVITGRNWYANTLRGFGGDDVLTGMRGADRLEGGSGADRFIYSQVHDSGVGRDARDVILDFSRAEGDRIDLSQIDAQTGLAGNQAFSFIGAAWFDGTAGALRAAQIGNTGATLIQGDIDGDKIADFEIEVYGIGAATAADFVL
ncbi:hypothetical protein [Tistrella mobilis]